MQSCSLAAWTQIRRRGNSFYEDSQAAHRSRIFVFAYMFGSVGPWQHAWAPRLRRFRAFIGAAGDNAKTAG